MLRDKTILHTDMISNAPNKYNYYEQNTIELLLTMILILTKTNARSVSRSFIFPSCPGLVINNKQKTKQTTIPSVRLTAY